jgi:hypothetical protein
VELTDDISNKNQLSGVLIFCRYCKLILNELELHVTAIYLQF